MNSILISLIWLFLINDQQELPQPADAAPTSIGVWTGPDFMKKELKPGPEEFQISQSIQYVLQDKTGTVWIATGEDGVCVFDGTDFTYFTKNDGLAGNAVRTILQDSEGNVWMATNGGISRKNKQGWTSYTTANGLPDNEILTLYLDKKGILWAGTRKGLAKFENEAFTTLPMFRSPRSPNDQPVQTPVQLIYEDNSGQLWFGTTGFGLFKFDGKTLENVIKPGC
ncbi:MAG: hypothetical protein KAF40_02245 [Flavihumibacter sp.]|nr:hypothetical protein [Flavihumibacter sp.]